MDATAGADAATLRHIIDVIHAIDEIRDSTEDLRDALRLVLKLLVAKLGARIAFVRYFDAYDEARTIAVDSHGIIKRELMPIIDALVPLAFESGSTPISPDPRVLGSDGAYLAIAMAIKDAKIGVLGIGKEAALGELDRITCIEASQMLDTMICTSNARAAEADKVELMGEIDKMLDANAYDLNHSLGDILEYVAQRLKAVTVMIFAAGDEEFRIVRANEFGRTIWDNYEHVRYAIMERIQDARYRDTCRIATYTEAEATSVANTKIRCIVANPLSTSGGETAGTLVLLFEGPVNERRLDLVQAASSLIDTAMLSQKRAQFMVQRFNKYVGSDILGMLLKNPEWLNPRKERVALLSVDLVGSTEFSNHLDDAFVFFENINHYLGMISAIIRNDFHGTLDKYIGDEVVGLFGAPIRDSGCGANAVACALQIRKAVGEFTAARKAAGKPCFDVKITVGMVTAIIGEVGALETLTDYTAMGGEVNEFYRICKHAIPGSIVLNRELAEEVKALYPIHLTNRARVKGIDEEIEIYELLAEGDPGIR